MSCGNSMKKSLFQKLPDVAVSVIRAADTYR